MNELNPSKRLAEILAHSFLITLSLVSLFSSYIEIAI